MKKELFNELPESIHEAVEIKKGLKKPARVTTYELPDVKATRAKVNMKQVDFAQAIGVSASLVQSREQHKRTPTGSSLKLLRVLELSPEMVNLFKTA